MFATGTRIPIFEMSFFPIAYSLSQSVTDLLCVLEGIRYQIVEMGKMCKIAWAEGQRN